jgi:proteasome assembly chaperone (PAC2) family protein
MDRMPQLNRPWMVAVWPGMGHVALNAGVYLLAKLGMTVVAEYEAGDLFDVDQVEVKEGLIQPGRRPRNRFFVWTDPEKQRDLVVFLGEAQPPLGKYPFCRQVIRSAKEFGVQKIFTFAAMATAMSPDQPSRVFVAATDQQLLREFKDLEVEILQEGQISGLNGVLLGAALEAGLPGACLLGEMPHVFAQLPVPKASLAILEIFRELSGISFDLGELAEQAESVDRQLKNLIAGMTESFREESEEEGTAPEPEPEEPASESRESRETPPLKATDRERIEKLFAEAKQDRSRAFVLKRELDQLGVFKDYEDRFLDLFKKPS